MGGLTAEGFIAGATSGTNGPDEGAGGDVIAEQAQQLNIGLEFNDGQWTPAQ